MSIFVTGFALLWSGLATAQTSPTLNSDLQPIQLQPIDMRVQDIGALSNSFRVVPSGIDVPGDFMQVYRLPGNGGKYSRIQGGLYIVFPESSYIDTEDGVVALVPAGTEFHIGEPPADVLDPASTASRTLPPGSEFLRWNTRIVALPADLNRNIQDGVTMRDMLDAAQSQHAAANAGVNNARLMQPTIRHAESFEVADRNDQDQTSPAIASDETYRAERLQELLRQAASAEANANRKPS